MEAAFRYCERVVREVDKDRFLATLFAPAERRPDLFALYAFNCEIERVRQLAREPMPGEIRLQWWRDALTGVRRSEAAANPVAAALFETIASHGLPSGRLLDLVEAHSFDLYGDPMMTLGELEGYGLKTASTLFELATKIVAGSVHPAATALSREAGVAYTVARMLMAFPWHAARRQLYVPLDILERHGAEPDDIFTGHASLPLRAALAEMRLRARQHLAAAREILPAVPAAALPVFLPAALVRPMLARMEGRSYDPFSPAEIPQWRRQWILWRASRNPRAMAR